MKNYIKVALVALMTIALVISVTPFAFATEAADTVVEAVTGETVADTAADSSAPEAVESSEQTGEETAPESGKETAAAGEKTPEVPTTGAEEKKGMSTGTIVGIVIAGVIVIIGVVLLVKNREKVAKFFREVKSELKKIVWTPWKQVKKNFVVVAIVVVLCAVAIGVLDVLFSKGIFALGNLF